MQDQKDYFYHYNKILHILDFDKFFHKILYDTLVLVILKIPYTYIS